MKLTSPDLSSPSQKSKPPCRVSFKNSGIKTSEAKCWLGRAIAGTTFICLSTLLSQRFFWEPQLKVNTVAHWDVVVPHASEAIDIEATRLAKLQARRNIGLVFQADADATAKAQQHLDEILGAGDRARKLAGELPYFATELISLNLQTYLRSCAESEWLQLQALTQNKLERDSLAPRVVELVNLRSVQRFEKFAVVLRQVRTNYADAKSQLNQALGLGGDRLLDLPEGWWNQDKQSMRAALQEIMAAGVVEGLPLVMRSNLIQKHRALPQARDRHQIATKILNLALLPNLKPDYAATEQLALQAEQAVKPHMVLLSAGRILVKAGDRISEREFAFLDSLQLTQRRPNLVGIAWAGGGVFLGMAIVGLAIGYAPGWLSMRLRLRDVAAICLTCIGVTAAGVVLGLNLGTAGLPFIPLAAASMILGSFYGSRLASLTTVVLAALLGVAIEASLIAYLPIALGAIAAAVLTNRPPTRSQLAMIGLVVATCQASAYLILTILTGGLGTLALVAIAYYGAGGLIASIVALGAIPYLEQISYHLTPIRLAELANLDRPLLRRLVTEAPGSFQHTLFVANLAEAGARALGADTALVRTGTLYHDVGKTLKPDFFIENQMGQSNPHDLIDDPWQSAQIIKEHVTGGIKLAQKYRLPQLLQAFIPEHQGTIAISYFYFKAKAEYPEADEADFRYDGPIPQSRETGIVMLADACEAALRSLGQDVNLDEAVEMVSRIFRKRWDDGQLLDAGLTPNELEQLAPVFIRVWRERNHGRIKYPALADKLDPTGSALPSISIPTKMPTSRERPEPAIAQERV